MARKGKTETIAAEDFEAATFLGERFWSKVRRSANPDECWPWVAYCDRDGYGKFQLPSGPVRAARLVLADKLRRCLGSNECVRHRCNNPPCCNPNHLLPGSRADNREDCVSARRHAFGSRHGRAKLNEAQVSEIKLRLASGIAMRALAREFGVRHWIIQQIKRGRLWRHVEA